MDTVRFGVMGLHNHYHAYPMGDYLRRGLPHTKLVAVADERERYAREFASAYAAEDYYSDYRRLVERDDIDAVIVTSYTSAHAEHVEMCAQAGKHVLLDKPIATSMKDAWRIVRAVEQHGVKLMMAHLLRLLPAYRKAKELLDQGVIGEPVSAIYSIRVPAAFIREAPDVTTQGWYVDPQKGGAGGFLDHAVHFTDFFRWFFATDGKNVMGRIASLTYKDLPVEDYGIAIITMQNGAICTVESTWHAAEWFGPMASPDRCTVTGTQGEIELHYQTSPQISVAGNRPPYEGRVYFDWKGEERYEICYRNLVQEFAQCILEDKPVLTDARDGLRALEMALAAYRSHQTNQAVELPLQEMGDAP
jgi:predicted dehydrogenase